MLSFLKKIVELKKQFKEAKKNKPKDNVLPGGSGISATPVPPVTVPSTVPGTVNPTTTSTMPSFAVPGGVPAYPTYPGYPVPGYPYYPMPYYPAPADPSIIVLPPVVDAKQ